jgi:glucose/arabinose dehydrogenase
MSGRNASYWAVVLSWPLLGGVCMPHVAGGDARLADITLPPGFSIDILASGVTNARAMCWGDKGTLFVGSRGEGVVHALRDTTGDGIMDVHHIIARDLNMPVGVAFRAGDLYVSAVDRILRYRDIEQRLEAPPEAELVSDRFPTETHHGWKFIAFGPDGHLYVPVGAPCNNCLPEDSIFATITKLDLATNELRIVAHGVRNSVGFDWHPRTGELWFTDNGRDLMGDDIPQCELDRAAEDGQHFGYPFCHAGTVADPEFGAQRSCTEFTPPAALLGPHTAPLGMRFYTGTSFPERYRGAIFIAQHGSWNRSTPIGYRLLVAFPQLDGTATVAVFAEGWLKGFRAWGRPVDVLVAPDGSLLVSDDAADLIYRIRYTGE